VDTINDRVWAVIDHNSEFAAAGPAAVPEPEALSLVGMGAALLIFGGAKRRRRKD